MIRPWHIITGEYPPQPGGVSDYTRLVARGLAAAGEQVEIWAPGGSAALHSEADAHEGITVHRLPDLFGRRSRRILADRLDALESPQRILVQYVPHAFGRRGANVPFCRWIGSRTRDAVTVMFHEVAYPFGGTLAQNGLAAINRLMASLVGRAAGRAFVSISAWVPWVEAIVRPGTPVLWLPVPSGIPAVPVNGQCASIRARFPAAAPVVGHFGTYGRHVQSLLDAAVPTLLARSNCSMLLIGRDSDRAARELGAAHPELAGRIGASGVLSPEDLSAHISACDVMLQPYPDGVSTRRTSSMAVLAHGRPLVSTDGALTEQMWKETGAARLVAADDAPGLALAVCDLLANASARSELGARGKATYDRRFDVRHTVAAIRGVA